MLVPVAPRLTPAAPSTTTAAELAASVSGPAFFPAPKFAGAKPGYVFKKGPRGLGYYLDPVQQQRGQQLTPHKQKPRSAVQTTLQEMQKQQWQEQQTARGSKADKQGKSHAHSTNGTNTKTSSKSKLPPLPGLVKKGKVPAFAMAGNLSDDDGACRVLDGGVDSSTSSGEDDGGSAQGAGHKASLHGRLQRQQQGQGQGLRKKALPGRLRKKLAKEAAAAAPKAHGKQGRRGKGAA